MHSRVGVTHSSVDMTAAVTAASHNNVDTTAATYSSIGMTDASTIVPGTNTTAEQETVVVPDCMPPLG